MNLHIYGQQMQHDDAVLVGDREALATLVQFIQVALGGPWGPVRVPDYYASDGEGYNITIKLLPQDDPRWDRLVPPYPETDTSYYTLGLLEFLAGEGKHAT